MMTQEKLLHLLYTRRGGRLLLKLLTAPAVSRMGGILMDSRLSSLAVPGFVKRNGIDLTDCERQEFRSFNDFFTRKLVPQARPVDPEETHLVSPCDGRLTVHPITAEGVFTVKETVYTMESLLRDADLAKRYEGGTLWLFRLCVDDYHRYIYPVAGRKSANRRIPGVFHTVNPIANEVCPIYKENTREFCLIRNENLGTVLMMEVGAMLVGRIENRQRGSAVQVLRGEEKGNFAFGGSTILLMTERGRVTPLERFAGVDGAEVRVRLGECVGAQNLRI